MSALLAPAFAAMILAELGLGIFLFVFINDLFGDLGRGFAASSTIISLIFVSITLLIVWLTPADIATGISAKWLVWSCLALLLYVFMAMVGTDIARRVVGGVAALVVLATLFNSATSTLGGPLLFVPAAILMGSTGCGMLLGHYYLIAPTLSFKPLRRATYLVVAAVAIWAVTIAFATITASSPNRQALVWGAQSVPFWLLVVGSGVVFTAGVDVLTWWLARIRSNQSATAMLYALIVSAVMGAVPAHLLSASLHMSL